MSEPIAMEPKLELVKLNQGYLKHTGSTQGEAAAMLTLAHCILETKLAIEKLTTKVDHLIIDVKYMKK